MLAVATAVLLAASLVAGAPNGAFGSSTETSTFRASDGKEYTATNHLIQGAGRPGGRSYLLVWTGAAEPTTPDFITVVDTTKGSRGYGKVLNTVTLGPQLQNEPHHMQYVWHKGDRIYAGGIMSDTVYVFDAKRLPRLDLVGVNVPQDTACGTMPDAFNVLRDGNAYVTYMGGPNVTGPCRYTNGEVREGNGAGGTPGEVVLMGPDGRTIAEIPATPAEAEDPDLCRAIPALPTASCANPHGIQVREDLDRMVTSDFAELRDFFGEPQFDHHLVRDTVRIFDIGNRRDPKLVSVSHLPVGPRAPTERMPLFNESRIVMETAVTNLPKHRGAFASTMFGGAVYYTPDITAADPQWREVFDDSTAYSRFSDLRGGGDGGSWLAVSPDDRFLFHTVLGTQLDLPLDVTSGMVYVLDIQKLLAAGADTRCNIDTIEEVTKGGAESDCPALAGVVPVRDVTNGGPHWAALDNFEHGRDGTYHETKRITRMAVANYFVAALIDGDHRLCMIDVGPSGKLSVDDSFRDEVTGKPCLNFNRTAWPHGSVGGARPHGVLFVAS
jgi:hypothetical protein